MLLMPGGAVHTTATEIHNTQEFIDTTFVIHREFTVVNQTMLPISLTPSQIHLTMIFTLITEIFY